MADTFVPLTFVADELLTSTKMNLLAANQAGFHDGTALGDGIIVTRHLGSASQLQLGSYSTTEQATREKWIDGKTIYKKTIGFTVSTANFNYPHSIPVDVPIDLVASTADTTMPILNPTNLAASTGFFFSKYAISIRTGSSVALPFPIVATVYYTKA